MTLVAMIIMLMMKLKLEVNAVEGESAVTADGDEPGMGRGAKDDLWSVGGERWSVMDGWW